MLALAALGGCVETGHEETLVLGDEAAYVSDVQPILEARCASLDCHGADGRPLRLYAETGRRLRDDLRGQPLAPEEVQANLRALAAIDPGAAPDENLIITKPLAGGVGHKGGDEWLDENEPQVVCVRGWLAGQSGDADVMAACATAKQQVMLPPP